MLGEEPGVSRQHTPDRVFTQPSELRGTPIGRQGYLPDLEPLLFPRLEGDLGRALIPRSRSSPDCSPQPPSHGSTSSPPEPHSKQAGALLVAVPSKKDGSSSKSKDRVKCTELWGTVSSMCSATLGAGTLSLPYAFEQLGILGGVGLLCTTAAASHFSVVLLTSAIARSGTRSYEELTVRLFGKPMGLLVELNIIAFCFGSAIAYTVALGDLLHPLTAAWLSRRAVMALFWGLVMLPLSFAERLSALQCASTFGVLSVAYLVLSVVVHASLCAWRTLRLEGWENLLLPQYESDHPLAMSSSINAVDASSSSSFSSYAASSAAATADTEEADAHLPPLPGVLLYTWTPQSFEALAIMMFAFTCQVRVRKRELLACCLLSACCCCLLAVCCCCCCPLFDVC